MKVKCKRCGMEYELPDVVIEAWATNCPPHSAIEPIMEDCPVCKDLDKRMKEIGL